MSREKSTEPVEWECLRFTVPAAMYKDLKIVTKANGITMAAFIRPLIREGIEAESRYLPVGSKRKKED